MKEDEEKEKEKEKFPHVCESIGHRPLWGRSPAPSFNFILNPLRQGAGTADHLTLLRLLIFQQFCCSCPNARVTAITAPVQLHATGVAVYLTLLINQAHRQMLLNHLFCVFEGFFLHHGTYDGNLLFTQNVEPFYHGFKFMKWRCPNDSML